MYRPIPSTMDMKPGEQWFVALERLLQRVQKQALAKAASTRQEIMSAFAQQFRDVYRLVHVVVVLIPNRAKRMNADGEFEFGHGAALALIVGRSSISLFAPLANRGESFEQQSDSAAPDIVPRGTAQLAQGVVDTRPRIPPSAGTSSARQAHCAPSQGVSMSLKVPNNHSRRPSWACFQRALASGEVSSQTWTQKMHE